MIVLLLAGSVVALAGVTVGRAQIGIGHFTSAQAEDRFRAAYAAAMAELPPPERTLDMRTRFGMVRVYRFAGSEPDGVPLVLLPGRASASPVWADNLATLRRLGPVYAIDLLGEPGLSIQSRPITSAADQAEWLAETLQQLPEAQFDVVGASIGGWTAVNVALHRPARVRSLTLIDPVLVFADLAPEAIVRSLPASVRWLPRSWRVDFASWTANDAPVEDVPVAAMIEAGMQTYALRLPAPRRPSEAQLRDLTVPTLVIVAGRSRMHDPAGLADVARRTLRDGRVEVYEDASHAVNGEQPDRIAADVSALRASLG